jgi:hypothetical protein
MAYVFTETINTEHMAYVFTETINTEHMAYVFTETINKIWWKFILFVIS